MIKPVGDILLRAGAERGGVPTSPSANQTTTAGTCCKGQPQLVVFALQATLHSHASILTGLFPQISIPTCSTLTSLPGRRDSEAASSSVCTNDDVTHHDMLQPNLSHKFTSLHHSLINSTFSSLL